MLFKYRTPNHFARKAFALGMVIPAALGSCAKDSSKSSSKRTSPAQTAREAPKTIPNAVDQPPPLKMEQVDLPKQVNLKLGSDSSGNSQLAEYTQRYRYELGSPDATAMTALQNFREEFVSDPNKFQSSNWFSEPKLKESFEKSLTLPRSILTRNKYPLFAANATSIPADSQSKDKLLRLTLTEKPRLPVSSDRDFIIQDMKWLVDRSGSPRALEEAERKLNQDMAELKDHSTDIERQYTQSIESDLRERTLVRDDIDRFQKDLVAYQKEITSDKGNEEFKKSIDELQARLSNAKTRLSSTEERLKANEKIALAHTAYLEELAAYKKSIGKVQQCKASIKERDENLRELAAAKFEGDDDLEVLGKAYEESLKAYWLSQELVHPKFAHFQEMYRQASKTKQ